MIHWPSTKKHYLETEVNEDGKKETVISAAVVEEWYKRIGYLDDAKVDKLLEDYLCNDDVNKYPPNVAYFLGRKNNRRSAAYKAPFEAIKGLRYKINEHRELMDSEGRIYADPEDPEGAFYLNTFGNICKKDAEGREIVWIR